MPPLPAAKWLVKCQCGAWLVGVTNAASETLTCACCGWSYRKGDLVPVLRHPDPHYKDTPPET